LQYTSKAAASGHEQAILNLTDFYQEVATVESTILKSDSIRKALNWVLSWRRGSTAALAREWQQVASVIGHKPSMLQLADYYDSTGNNERARRYLHQIIETPSTTNQKEGSSQLLQVARKRLAGFR
jgi:TPR repeat protein